MSAIASRADSGHHLVATIRMLGRWTDNPGLLYGFVCERSGTGRANSSTANSYRNKSRATIVRDRAVSSRADLSDKWKPVSRALTDCRRGGLLYRRGIDTRVQTTVQH